MNEIISVEKLHDPVVIYESAHSTVFKAVNDDGQRVVIKQLSIAYPTNEAIAHLEQESIVSQHLSKVEGVIACEFKKNLAGWYLIMPDMGGVSLDSILEQIQSNFLEALEVSIAITKILSEVHANGVLHKDINPSNILWNSLKKQITLIDFGLATFIDPIVKEVLAPGYFEGTIAYLAPEQTGRIPIQVDYRTDLYSLGVTLYQLFTGKLPFYASDTVEMIYSHIAKIPASPLTCAPDLPPELAKIILKLLSKNPIERYQSASGLLADLDLVYALSKQGVRKEAFVPGLNDFPKKLQLAQKLFGKENHFKRLIHQFKQTCKGNNNWVLISGKSGTGKTRLGNELYEHVVQANGFFLRGRYDTCHMESPLTAFVQAFSSFVVEILSGSSQSLEFWKEQILKTVGPSGQILIQYIPEIEQVIGKQEQIPVLNPVEAQNRLLMMIRNLIKLIAKEENPLVLFFDDIQCIDPLSVTVLKDLVKHHIPYFMIVCSLNDTSKPHYTELIPLIQSFEKERKTERIQLTNLTEADTARLLADTLQMDVFEVEDISRELFLKSRGNYLVLEALLKNLYENGHIFFDHSKRIWSWAIEKFQDIVGSADIEEILRVTINRLPGDCKDTLGLAACMGNSFEIDVVAAILQRNVSDVYKLITPALQEGLLYACITRSDNTKEILPNLAPQVYHFYHYSIPGIITREFPEKVLQNYHLQIWSYYYSYLTERQLNEQLVELIPHLNFGVTTGAMHPEAATYANLNLKAARKLMTASAYSAAYTLYGQCLGFLSPSDWAQNYRIAFEAYSGYAESAYQLGKNEEADNATSLLLSNSQTAEDKANVLAVQLRYYVTQGKPDEALQIGVEALKILGVSVSLKPGMLKVLFELIKVKLIQGRRKTPTLIDIPVLKDNKQRIIARLLSEMGAPAFTLGNDVLYALLALKVVRLGLKMGFVPELPYALVAFGMLQNMITGKITAGYEYGKLAIDLNVKHNEIENRCRVYAAYGVLIHHWVKHWKTLNEWFEKGIEAGYYSGDVFYLGHSAANCVAWDPTLNLSTLVAKHQEYITIIKESGFADAHETAQLRLQVLKNYIGETVEPTSLSDNTYDENIRFKEMSQRNYVSGIAIFHLSKAEIFLSNALPLEAFEQIEMADSIIQSLVGLNYNLFHCVLAFHSASQASDRVDLSASVKSKLLLRMRKEEKRMRQWAKRNPENYLHHHLLMQAELVRKSNKGHHALPVYEQAIQTARRNQWLKDEAFANELTARFLVTEGLYKAASGYLYEALYLYRRWGAVRKIHQLKESYTKVSPIGEKPIGASSVFDFEVSSYGNTETVHIGVTDMETIVKASQAISGEVVFVTLLQKLMHILLENAGGQRAVLILKDADELFVQAEIDTQMTNTQVLASVPLYSYHRIPKSIINYVTNAKQGVVLADASFEGNFTQDPYVQQHNSKSILVEPIIRLGEVQGAIFIENNLNVGVFSTERQRILRFLSTQIAISIENSKLYEGLEEKIRQRTAILENVNKELSGKNTQIQHQKQELEKLNASKDKMFSVIAHDLKSPFSALLGISRMLSTNYADLEQAEVERLSKQIYTSGNKVYSLLENLLDWARSQTGGFRFDPVLFVLHEVIDDVVDIQRDAIEAKEIEFHCSVKPSLMVFADPQMVHTILRNLLGNAIKYSNKKGLIRITATTNHVEATIEVADNGIGISSERIATLFNFDSNQSTPGTENEKGTGLGLIICKEYVEKNNGKISVVSHPENGSSFIFTLPLTHA